MTLLGLEHEYIVRSRGRRLDFRALLPALDLPGRQLDPGDRHARRLTSGAVVTADVRDAEVVAPPLDLASGFGTRLSGWAWSTTATLAGVLPAGHQLQGVSTHLSVQVPDADAVATASLFARHFAPALMVLANGDRAHGLMVRPRHERVEVGCGFARGPVLRAAAALSAGGVLACHDATRQRRARLRLPARVDATLEPAVGRFGWWLDRDAVGGDILRQGRSAGLRVHGRHHEAQAVLEDAWGRARERLVAAGMTPVDVADADALVAGTLALACEQEPAFEPEPAAQPPAHPAGRVVQPLVGTGVVLDAVAATWDFTVFAVSGQRPRLISVPAARLARFLSAFDGGHLDDWLGRVAAQPDEPRVLTTYAQAAAGGVFDAVVLTPALAAPVRDRSGATTPMADLIAPAAGSTTIAAARHGKADGTDAGALAFGADRPGRRWVWLALGGSLAAAIAVGAWALLGRNEGATAVAGAATPIAGAADASTPTTVPAPATAASAPPAAPPTDAAPPTEPSTTASTTTASAPTTAAAAPPSTPVAVPSTAGDAPVTAAPPTDPPPLVRQAAMQKSAERTALAGANCPAHAQAGIPASGGPFPFTVRREGDRWTMTTRTGQVATATDDDGADVRFVFRRTYTPVEGLSIEEVRVEVLTFAGTGVSGTAVTTSTFAGDYGGFTWDGIECEATYAITGSGDVALA